MATIVTDGRKSVSLLNPDAWVNMFGTQGKVNDARLYQTVAILNRCIRMRSDAAAHIPFALRKGKTDVTTSDDWVDPKGIMPNPRRLLRQLECALLFTNAAYAWKNPNQYGITKGLQFFSPQTTQPMFNESTGELLYYIRPDRQYSPDEVMSVWYQDGITEVGPSAATIVGAASAAAGVLHYLDQFAQSYFQRGAIKVTILGVPQGTSKESRDEVEGFFNRALTGIRNAFAVKAINADAIKPTVIGDGIEALANNTLTVQEREDIATAFGVPMSMVMSNAANYATAQQDERNLIQWAVLPDCELIAEALTEQVYGKWGYTFEFRPETMDSFQEDEVNRAGAYAQYVGSGMKPSTAAQIVGIEMPADMEYSDLDPEPEPEPEPIPAALAPFAGQDNPPAEPMIEEPVKRLTPEIIKELNIWQWKAAKALKAGQPADCEFTLEHIDPARATIIHAALQGAQTEADIKAIFEREQSTTSDPLIVAAYDLIEALRAI